MLWLGGITGNVLTSTNPVKALKTKERKFTKLLFYILHMHVEESKKSYTIFKCSWLNIVPKEEARTRLDVWTVLIYGYCYKITRLFLHQFLTQSSSLRFINFFCFAKMIMTNCIMDELQQTRKPVLTTYILLVQHLIITTDDDLESSS